MLCCLHQASFAERQDPPALQQSMLAGNGVVPEIIHNSAIDA